MLRMRRSPQNRRKTGVPSFPCILQFQVQLIRLVYSAAGRIHIQQQPSVIPILHEFVDTGQLPVVLIGILRRCAAGGLYGAFHMKHGYIRISAAVIRSGRRDQPVFRIPVRITAARSTMTMISHLFGFFFFLLYRLQFSPCFPQTVLRPNPAIRLLSL